MPQSSNIANQKFLGLVPYFIIAGLLLVLHLYHPPQRGLWAQTFFDSLHVPVFGLIALSLYAAIPNRPHNRRIILAFMATAVLGILSEAVQIFSARDASLDDLIADLFGAAGFLSVAAAVSGRYSGARGKRILASLLAIALLGWSMFPLAKVSAAYVERNSRVPLLVNFDSASGDLFIYKQNIDFQVVQLPEDDHKVANITFGPGPWPGVTFHDLWPDWRDYSMLIVELSNAGSEPLEINLRVHDQAHLQHDQMHIDRFNTSFTLNPGKHVLQIPLEKIQQSPRDRLMDLSKIEGIIIFGRSSIEKKSFYVHEISLH